MHMANLANFREDRTSMPLSRLGNVARIEDGSSLRIGECSKPKVHEVELISLCKSNKISSLFSSFDTQKAELLKSIGFDGLLKLPMVENINNELCIFLYERFDLKNRCLHLNGGCKLYFQEADVYLVFGIPFVGHPVNYSSNQCGETVCAFKDKLSCVSSSSSLSMSYLEHILTKDYGSDLSDAEKDAFKIASVMYSLGYLLGPELHHEFPIQLIKNFVPDVKPEELNWSYLVLSTLGRASQFARQQLSSGVKKIVLYGCSLFLQVFYLDNLNFGLSTPYHSVLPRASAYTPEFMSKQIICDSTICAREKFMQFGKTPVREAFDVCYTRGWHDHAKNHCQLERISQDDYLSSVEILSEGIQLLDKMATQYTDPEAMEAFAISYANFRSKNNKNIHSLSTKASDFLKRRNLSLHYRHIRREVPSTTPSRLSSGTSFGQVLKRSKISGSTMFKRIARRNLKAQAPIARQLSPYAVLSGGTHDIASSSRNVEQVLCHAKLYSVDANAKSSVPPYSQKKVVTNHSNFSESRCDIMFSHPDVRWEFKYACYLWMTNTNLSKDELDCNWIRLCAPKPLCIRGDDVRDCLRLNGSFTVGLVDAIMAVWSYLDLKVYNHSQTDELEHKIWRHFLPASFADMVIDNRDILYSDSIRASFIGEHITYNVHDCQKIILPVIGKGKNWSCYFWDFKLKTITVLDPVLMNSSSKTVKRKHHGYVWKLHSALLSCIDHFFYGWNPTYDGWADIYLTKLGHQCKPQNSGLYAVHYGRAFSGKEIAYNLKDPLEATLCEARGEILYNIFTCDANGGYKPDDLMDKIAYFKF